MSENKIYAEVKMVETDKLKPNEYNPNQMSDEQFGALVEDFRENGFVGQPIIVDRKNKIIDGEHRWRAAKFLKLKKVPVVEFSPKDKDHQKMLTIGWNSKRGEFNPLKLAEIIQELNKKYTLDQLSGKLGFSANQLEDKLSMAQVTPEFIEKLKAEAKQVEQELPLVLNFALSKGQEKLINEALEIAVGKSKGEKLYYICYAFLKDKPRDDQK